MAATDDRKFKRKQKLVNQIKALLLILIVAATLISGHWLGATILLVAAYVAHELLWSDHLFYDPRRDYHYLLNPDHKQSVVLTDNNVQIDSLPANATHFIKVKVTANLSGRLFDPYIEISTGGTAQCQYFERNLAGMRYINISHLLNAEKGGTLRLSIHAHHCTVDNQLAVLSFANPELAGKKVLIIAPHADDAELAAFGLYSQQHSFIATLTAGEVGAGYYRRLAGNTVEASRLKGRLRAWDGVMISQWGGIKADETVQLGYFCMTLEQMAEQRDHTVTSRTAQLSDTRYFRAFNSIKLASDANGQASWDNLVSDISEVLERFQADIIVTPHPTIDPHRDHHYATAAVVEACARTKEAEAPLFLLYANHYRATDMFPFGPSGTIASLPPEFDTTGSAGNDGSNGNMKIFSSSVTGEQQRDKLMAIAMMHDLLTPLAAKKKLRKWLQHLILRRDICPYGDDDYLRKAVRSNELFYRLDLAQLQQLLTAGQDDSEDASSATTGVKR